MHYPRWKRLLDKLFEPVMYWLQGTRSELPQQTHFWNNERWDAGWYHQDWFLSFSGDTNAKQPRFLGFIPLFHMPRLGGWKRFVVLEPVKPVHCWRVAWTGPDNGGGITQIPLSGPVRMTIGPRPVRFYGLTSNGKQIQLRCLGKGEIGKAGPYANIPLL